MGSGKGRKFDPTEELGINAVQKAVLTYGWIFRDKRQADFGIDGEIEIVSDDQTVTGKLLGVQIKSGPSFFKDATGRELRFYATPEHRDYWLGYAVPVVIAFHNPDNDETIWQFTDSATSSGKNWRIDVPRTNTFNADAKTSLAQVAAAGKTLNQVSASRMVDSIVGDVSKGQQASKPKEVTLATEQVEGVAPLLQAEFGEAGLSAAALSQISKLLDEKLAPSRHEGDPRELIPEADRDKPEAIHALLEFLRVRDDPSWPHEAIAAHEAKPDDQGVKRLWALGVLELATTDGRFVAGGQSDVPVEDVRRVAEFLRDEVEQKITNGYADIDDVANEATNAAISRTGLGASVSVDAGEPGQSPSLDELRRARSGCRKRTGFHARCHQRCGRHIRYALIRRWRIERDRRRAERISAKTGPRLPRAGAPRRCGTHGSQHRRYVHLAGWKRRPRRQCPAQIRRADADGPPRL